MTNSLIYQDNVTANIKQKIEKLNSPEISIDMIWQQLGEQLGEAATGRSKIQNAKRVFNRRLDEIKLSLCEDEKIKKFLNDPKTLTQVDLALIFAGKLSEDLFEGLDLATVAVLVAQLGLMQICAES